LSHYQRYAVQTRPGPRVEYVDPVHLQLISIGFRLAIDHHGFLVVFDRVLEIVGTRVVAVAIRYEVRDRPWSVESAERNAAAGNLYILTAGPDKALRLPGAGKVFTADLEGKVRNVARRLTQREAYPRSCASGWVQSLAERCDVVEKRHK